MLVSGRVDTSQSSSVDQGSWPGMHDKNYLLGLRWLSGVALPHCHSDGTASTSFTVEKEEADCRGGVNGRSAVKLALQSEVLIVLMGVSENRGYPQMDGL